MSRRGIFAAMIAVCVGAAAHGAPENAQRTLRWETVVHAPVQEVWDAFTTQEGLESWMFPRAIVDWRIGGTLRTHDDPEAAQDDEGWFTHRVLAFEAPRMFSTRAVYPDDMSTPPVVEEAWSVVRLDPISDRLTRVTIAFCGLTVVPEWEDAEQYMNAGSASVMARLQQRFPPPTEHAGTTTPDPISRAAVSLRFVENPIVAEQIVPAGRAETWRALTTSEGLESFFAQKAIVDLRIGGLYELHFLPDAPPGARGADDCHVLAYVPEEMLAISWNAPPPFPAEREERTFVVFRLEDAPDGATLVRLHHGGWREGAEWDKVRAYFVRVWPHVLDALAARLGGEQGQ
ncbi:MAG: SRPBCC domain-containing protein [Phycisphaerales bacterium]|nr:MAG: SRPBCC domain-containing protein [Phycisphaerales bacterium]